jgi:membrane associated rhomboid family serine protease
VVIPVHDVNPARRTPWITYALIAANIVVFVLTPAAATAGVEEVNLAELCRQEAFYERYGAVPKELVDNAQLSRVPTGETGVGRGGAGCVVGPPAYEKLPYLSVLTSMFLHGGWLHLLGNMLFLWIFGNNVEERFSRLGFALFYLFCGYVAAYGFALANPESIQPLVGASGAVSGVLGAYLVLFPLARVWSVVPILFFIPLKLPAWIVLGMWFVLQWVYSAGYAVSDAAGSVAYLAHVIGFAVGVLIAIPVRLMTRPPPPTYGPYWPPPRRTWRRIS